MVAGASGAAAPSSFREFIGEGNAFKPGWAKAAGVPETLEAKFTTVEGLLKSHVNLESMLGASGKVVVPGADATPEARAAFNKAIGVPDKPEGYGLKQPDKVGDKALPKELWDQNRVDGVQKLAHEIGLTPAQLNKLVEFDLTHNLAAAENATLAHQTAINKASDALKAEWGSKFDAQLKVAQSAAKEAGLDMSDPLIGNHPGVIKALATLGAKLGETPAAGVRQGNQPADAQSQIASIMADRKGAYWNAAHPQHQAAVQRVMQLREQSLGRVAVSNG